MTSFVMHDVACYCGDAQFSTTEVISSPTLAITKVEHNSTKFGIIIVISLARLSPREYIAGWGH